MSFVSPLLLLGLLGAALPLLVHLIGRDRAPRKRFAALDFVLRSNRRMARRLRLRQLLLLITRMALCAGIAVVLSKPFVETRSDLPAVNAGQQAAVLVLDDTASMSRQGASGTSLFALAQQRAEQVAGLLGARADLAVLSVTRPGGPLTSLTRDNRAALRAIAGLKVSARHATVSASLLAAGRVLSESRQQERRVFLFTDMAAHGFADTPAALPAGVRLHLVDVAPGAPHNRAVVRLEASASSAPGPRATRLSARVCNYNAAEHSARLALHINGKQSARGLLKLKPWECKEKLFQHTFGRGGVHRAMVSLAADSMPLDDGRYLRVEVESPLRVLLVNGAPSPVRHRDELFYLETALATADRGRQVLRTTQVTADELEQTPLDGFDVVALCNVGRVSAARAKALDTFVRKGRGLLVAPGNEVNPGRINRTLGPLLPQLLRGAVSAAPPGSGRPALSIGRVATGHPVIRALMSGRAGGGLRKARFTRIFLLHPATRANRRVVMWYDDGSPALVETRRGEGRVLLFTSPLDRDWNDLPIRPGYLPLVQQAVRYLSQSPLAASRRSVEVGVPGELRLPAGTRQVRVAGPGPQRQWSGAELTGKTKLSVPVERPGFYKVSVAGTNGVLRQLERESFAANINPLESDPRKRQQPATRASDGRGALALQRVELWHLLAALVLLLLVMESFLVRRA